MGLSEIERLTLVEEIRRVANEIIEMIRSERVEVEELRKKIMNVRPNYVRIFEDSWRELCEMTRNGIFAPHQEQDIVCMMYHLCLEKLKDLKLIHASSWRFDLILGDIRTEERKDQRFSRCLLAEIKFILNKGRKSKRLEVAHRHIDKLSLQGDPAAKKIFAIFDKANCIKPGEIDELRQHTKNVKVLYGC